MRCLLTMLLISCMLLIRTLAYGQAPDKEQARRHFHAATKLETQRDYEAAALEYLEAYELFPSPELFYNAARAYHLHGSVADAIKYYRRYIDLAPNGRAAALARAAIASLEDGSVEVEPRSGLEIGGAHVPGQENSTDVVEQDHASGPGSEASPESGDRSSDVHPVPTRDPMTEPRGLPRSRSSTKPDSAKSIVMRDRTRTIRGRTARVSGLVVAGAGLVSLSVGVLFGIEARHLAGDVEGVREQWTDADLSKYPDGRNASAKAIVFAGAGTAALLAGGALHIWGLRRMGAEARGQVSVAPLISSSNTGLSIAGVF
jgi:hypothetical protein